MRVRSLAAAALAVALLAADTGGAYASPVTYPTVFVKFKLERSNGERKFTGKIDSTKGKCVKSRKVKLIRKHNGNKKTLAHDKTNDNGHFKMVLSSGDVKNGTYYAKATKKKFDNGQKVCLARQSGTIKIS